MSVRESREDSRDSPTRARSLLTVRAAISSARSSERPLSSSLFFTCSYIRPHLEPFLIPLGGIAASFRYRCSPVTRRTPCESRGGGSEEGRLSVLGALALRLRGAPPPPLGELLAAPVARIGGAVRGPHQRADPLALRRRRVGATVVEPPVPRNQIRPRRREPGHEDLLHPRPEVEGDPVDEGGAGLLGQRDDLLDQLRGVVDPRHQGRYQHT